MKLLNFMDDLRNIEEVQNAHPILLAHTEIAGRGKRADNFIVSLSNMGDQEPVCYFEYSKSQIEEIRSSGLDGQTPWTYKEMENYLKLQRSSLKMRGTNKNCGERGVIISNTNMTNLLQPPKCTKQ